jgi:hypothetical protein
MLVTLARRTAANFTAANVIAEASTIFTLISSQITLAATVVPPTPPPAPAAPALAAISSTPAADAAVAAISSSSTTSKRRKPKAAPPQNPPPAPANQPNQPSGGCWNCRAPGCHSSRCPFPKATVNTPPSKPYPVCSLSVVDAPTTHTPWSQPLQLTTRALLGSLTTVALFDTGASVSAIDTSFAATASLPIAPYTGPRLRAAHGHEVVPRGQITIPTLTLPGWTGPLGPIAVIDNLVASLLIGLPDMKRFGTVHIDLRTATPRLFLGTTPPAALIAALGVVEPSLLSASTAAADAEHRLHADDAAAADGAIPLPAGLSPSNARTAPPEIDFDSAAEIAHRTDFHARHADAHHQLHLADDVPPSMRTTLTAITHEHSSIFATKEPHRKPPVINCSLPDVYPLQLFLRAGAKIQATTQPPYYTKRHLDFLKRECDMLLREGRAEIAVRALAIAPSFVVEPERVVIAGGDGNAILMPTAHTIPSVDHLVRELASFGAKWYLCMDLLSGFNQWPYAKGSGGAACFHMAGLTLYPKVASMGIHAVPAEFHHLISTLFTITPADIARDPLLADVKLLTFVDDICGGAKTDDAFCALYRHVCRVAARIGFTFSVRKCHVATSDTTFLGSRVRDLSVSALSTYTADILALGRPTTRQELQSLLGAVGWIMPHLVRSAYKPIGVLRALLRSAAPSPSTKLIWSPDADNAFLATRTAIAQPDILHAFDPTLTPFLITDASEHGASVAFMQLHDGVLRLVTAMCITFTSAQRNYSTPEQEFAALRSAILQFEPYVLGRTVVWLSDNKGMIEFVRTARVSTKRRLRTSWLDMCGVRIYASHIAGSLNVLTDCLSRNPALKNAPPMDDNAPVEVFEISITPPASSIATLSPTFPIPTHVVAQFPDITSLISDTLHDDASLAPARLAADTATPWLGNRFEWSTYNGTRLLFARTDDRTSNSHPARLVIPAGLRQSLLERLHIAHNSSWSALHKSTRRTFFWPGIRAHITAFLDGCDACKRARAVRAHGNFGDSERDPHLTPTRVGDLYQMDKWHWPLANGDTLIIQGAIDLYTGYAFLQRVPAHTSASAATFLHSLHRAFGPMRGIHTDGGPEYHGAFTELVHRLGIHHTRGSPGNSNSQARIERVFRSLNDVVTRMLTHGPWTTIDLDDAVAHAQLAINSVVSRAVPGAPASSAFFRQFGRPPPLSTLMASTTTPMAPESPLLYQFSQLAVALVNHAARIDSPLQPFSADHRAARRAAAVKQSQQSVHGAHGAPVSLAPGDHVFLHVPNPPMGKIRKITGGRLGPFLTVHVDPTGPDGTPLKAELEVLGDYPAPNTPTRFTVLVRNLTKCGPSPNIDDPQLRCLPPSGFFVGELTDDASLDAAARLQAIIDQSSIPPHQLALVRARRPPLATSGHRVGGGKSAAINLDDDDDDDDDDDIVVNQAQLPRPVGPHPVQPANNIDSPLPAGIEDFANLDDLRAAPLPAAQPVVQLQPAPPARPHRNAGKPARHKDFVPH